MTTFLAYLPFILFLLIFLGSGIALSRQAQRRLLRWLHHQGYQDVRFEQPPLFRPGPFFMLNKRGWGVKRLIVRQGDGSERKGWVMYPAGLFVDQLSEESYKVTLVWDDEWDKITASEYVQVKQKGVTDGNR